MSGLKEDERQAMRSFSKAGHVSRIDEAGKPKGREAAVTELTLLSGGRPKRPISHARLNI